MNKKGFTLIEVVVSVAIFSLVMVSVFAFYGNSMNNQAKLKEKYTLLRISRQFIDAFVNDNNRNWKQRKGVEEKEGFLLKWNMVPVGQKKDVLFTSGRAPTVQLHRVRLVISKKGGKKGTGEKTNLLTLDFLVNAVSTR